MSDTPVSLQFITKLIDRVQAEASWTEIHGPGDGPYRALHNAENAGQSAGYLRLWVPPANLPLDRMVHLRLVSGPVETQLLFIFGRADTTMPHLHAQVVQFPPDGCVYNMDYLPRVDPVDHPDWFTRVFGPLRRSYRQATADQANSCAQAPANPALAIFMSPWGIASGRADLAELEKLTPCLDEYLEHYLRLATTEDWSSSDPAAMADRDRRHLSQFFADELDPRAWNGVYKVVGEETGRRIKAIFQTPISSTLS